MGEDGRTSSVFRTQRREHVGSALRTWWSSTGRVPGLRGSRVARDTPPRTRWLHVSTRLTVRGPTEHSSGSGGLTFCGGRPLIQVTGTCQTKGPGSGTKETTTPSRHLRGRVRTWTLPVSRTSCTPGRSSRTGRLLPTGASVSAHEGVPVVRKDHRLCPGDR